MTPRRADTKETMKPTDKTSSCGMEKAWPFFIRSRPVAASIVGTARRKENSTIVFLLSPRIKPPMIVAADRDTPGTMAIHWKSPIRMHVP